MKSSRVRLLACLAGIACLSAMAGFSASVFAPTNLDSQVYGFTDSNGKNHPAVLLDQPPTAEGKRWLWMFFTAYQDGFLTAYGDGPVLASPARHPGNPLTYWVVK